MLLLRCDGFVDGGGDDELEERNDFMTTRNAYILVIHAFSVHLKRKGVDTFILFVVLWGCLM